jgi:hypothetical protein
LETAKNWGYTWWSAQYFQRLHICSWPSKIKNRKVARHRQSFHLNIIWPYRRSLAFAQNVSVAGTSQVRLAAILESLVNSIFQRQTSSKQYLIFPSLLPTTHTLPSRCARKDFISHLL